MINLNMLLTYKELVSNFIHLLHPLTKHDLEHFDSTDVDDSDAMISDVSGYLQGELYEIGCTLIVYHYNDFPMYRVIGTPTKLKDVYMFIPSVIHPRVPMYTYLE